MCAAHLEKPGIVRGLIRGPALVPASPDVIIIARGVRLQCGAHAHRALCQQGGKLGVVILKAKTALSLFV